MASAPTAGHGVLLLQMCCCCFEELDKAASAATSNIFEALLIFSAWVFSKMEKDHLARTGKMQKLIELMSAGSISVFKGQMPQTPQPTGTLFWAHTNSYSKGPQSDHTPIACENVQIVHNFCQFSSLPSASRSQFPSPLPRLQFFFKITLSREAKLSHGKPN